MQARLETAFGQVLNDAFVRNEELVLGARRDGLSVDRVRVVVVENEDVLVARYRGANKLSSLV